MKPLNFNTVLLSILALTIGAVGEVGANVCSRFYHLSADNGHVQKSQAVLPEYRSLPIDFKQLPSAFESVLPADVLKIINDFKARGLKSSIGDGENVILTIDGIDSNAMSIGRHIAAKYIEQIVRVLFPRAQIIKRSYKTFETNYWVRYENLKKFRSEHKGKQLVEIALSDSTGFFTESHFLNVPMPKVKLANPGIGNFPHKSFRPRLGIPNDQTIFSLYLKSPKISSKKAPSSNAFVDEFLKLTKKPDIIFISESGGNRLQFERISDAYYSEYKVINLSEWSQAYESGKKFIVLNDLEGAMPGILNISDSAFVSGPINIVEPTTAGTKVFFMNNLEVLDGFDSFVFNGLADLVRSTGGGFQLESIDDLAAEYDRVSKRHLTIVPTFRQESVVLALVQSIVSVVERNKSHQEYIQETIDDLTGATKYHRY